MKVSASILSADFANLGQEIKLLELANTDMIHIDVMDGHFVPNLTFGPPIIKSIRSHTNLPFDVHLMIENPENWIKAYAEAGANMITIHPNSTKHLHRTITLIKDLGIKAGIALLPTTPISALDYIIEDIDLILVMSVNPGFGGQKFIPSQINKIQLLSQKIKNNDIILSVDGGINNETGALCAKAGANLLVAGNYIFSGNYQERILNLKK